MNPGAGEAVSRGFHVLRRLSLLLFHSRVFEKRESECLHIGNLSLTHFEDVH